MLHTETPITGYVPRRVSTAQNLSKPIKPVDKKYRNTLIWDRQMLGSDDGKISIGITVHAGVLVAVADQCSDVGRNND